MHDPEERLRQFDEVQRKSRKVFESKNSDYADAYAAGGVFGVTIFLLAKFQRAANIMAKHGQAAVEEESLVDTLIDAHNYAALGLLLLENKEVVGPTVHDIAQKVLNER